MTRRDWWFGIVLIVLAILVHALMPRYQFQIDQGETRTYLYRIDRWTGEIEGCCDGSMAPWMKFSGSNQQGNQR